MSSLAMPRFFDFHAREAQSTSLLADISLFDVEETIWTASWFDMTSHTCVKKPQKQMLKEKKNMEELEKKIMLFKK